MGSGAFGGAASGAATGAMLGSIVPGVGTAVGAAVGGGMGFLSGMAGDAAAQAQGNIAGAQLAEQRATRAAAMNAANPSPQEIAAMNEAIALNAQDIERKKKLLASADPAMIEAGEQALSLMQGKEAAALGPLKNQRAKERKQLEAQLRSQLGSGYANSTAGIQALSAFDEASNNVFQNAQQNSIAQFMGYTAPISQAGLQSNIQNSQSIASMFGNQSARAISAINGTPITAAGSQYAEGLARATQLQSSLNGVMNTGATLGGMYMMGAGNAAGGSFNSPYKSPLAGSIYEGKGPGG